MEQAAGIEPSVVSLEDCNSAIELRLHEMVGMKLVGMKLVGR